MFLTIKTYYEQIKRNSEFDDFSKKLKTLGFGSVTCTKGRNPSRVFAGSPTLFFNPISRIVSRRTLPSKWRCSSTKGKSGSIVLKDFALVDEYLRLAPAHVNADMLPILPAR